MALNGNLDVVLTNVIQGVAPVIKRQDGLYTYVNFIKPSYNSGTNLNANYVMDFSLPVYSYITLLGTWDSNYYSYNEDNHKWVRNDIVK